MRRKMKLGFSDIGGIYIGENIRTGQSLHHAITIALSFNGNFDFECEGQQISSAGIIIQANTVRKFNKLEKSPLAFIHIEPFCVQGLKLTNKTTLFAELTQAQAENIRALLQKWLLDERNSEELTADILDKITAEIGTDSGIKMEPRIHQAINIIRKSEEITLKQVSEHIHLSVYRFSHLFKEQTGISFREFVLYTKLVKSLKAIYNEQTLTDSSHSGGFSDQAHFTRTYYKAFGVLPSHSVK